MQIPATTAHLQQQLQLVRVVGITTNIKHSDPLVASRQLHPFPEQVRDTVGGDSVSSVTLRLPQESSGQSHFSLQVTEWVSKQSLDGSGC